MLTLLLIGVLLLHWPLVAKLSKQHFALLIVLVAALTLLLPAQIFFACRKVPGSEVSGIAMFLASLLFILLSCWFLVYFHFRLKSDFLLLEDKFIKVFNTSPHGMAIVRVSDSMILEVNSAFLRVSGYSVEEVLGKTSVGQGMWHHPEQREKMISILLNYQSFGPIEYEFIPKSGKPTIFFLTAQLILIKGEKYLVAHFEEKPDKSSSGQEARILLGRKLREIMSGEALYKTPGITLADLAEKLDTNKTYLSQVINSEYGNFNEYLNKFRVIEACRLIQTGLDPRFSIDHLYQEVGFSSRTTFYKAFKKFTGVSPARFRQINVTEASAKSKSI